VQLIQKARLFFQQGGSDKVYEVDLCEVGPGEYVVNFRYGRRGANLKEGTKTVFPVPLDKAQKEFDKLVNGKKRKGYADLPGTAPGDAPEDASSVEEKKTGMADKVLEYLAKAAAGTYDEKRWKLSRVIWRAGELKLQEAAQYLNQISPRDDKMFNYCLAWALGRCGNEDSIRQLRKISRHPDPMVKRIASEALLRLGNDAARKAVADAAIEQMPISLRDAVKSGDADKVSLALKELVFSLKTDHNGYLFLLYQVAAVQEFVRAPLMKVLSKVKLRPPFFRPIRHIYKAAEFREDNEISGILYVRIEKERAFFKMPKWWRSAWIGGQYVEIDKEIIKDDSKLAFSNLTRNYLLRRANTALDALAHSGKGYTSLARFILLQYKDGEGLPAHEETFWHYKYTNGNWNYFSTKRYYPAMGNFLLLFHIMYGKSTRYKPGAQGARWTYRPPATPEDPPPTAREELHQHLWDEAPEDLKAILVESRCAIVVEFAAKAFKVNPHRAKHIDTAFIKGLLRSPYEVATRLGLELAREVYNAGSPDKELLLALVECDLPTARELGLQWMSDAKRSLFDDARFLGQLVLNRFPDVRRWTSDQLKASYLNSSVRDKVTQGVLKALLKVKPEKAADWVQEWMSGVIDLMLMLFAESLRKVTAKQLVKLAEHPWENMQLFAGRILLEYFEPKEKLPEEALHALMDSEWPTVRGLGAEVFGKLPVSVLVERKDIVAGFCVSRHAEVRAQAAPIVAKLVKQDSEFAVGLLKLFVPALWRKETHEGVHDDLLHLVRDTLKDHLAQIPADHIWKLIDSDHRAAHELGHHLLTGAIDPEKLEMSRIVGLGSHELLALRRYVWEYFSANVPRIKYEREQALKLLDAAWEDSRKFGRDFFDAHFDENDWTPELLVSICDSVREELQTFGRQLITRFFKEADGEQYLLKLSQHPKTELQLFVTNYLERYASGNPDRIIGLDLYFRAVLGQVRKGRVAKERIFSFLHKEARASEKVAAYLVPLLDHLVVTISQKDRAHCIRILTDLRYRYPHLDSPLTLQTFTTK
jgi:predicted DNA-binding WGR domain protein